MDAPEETLQQNPEQSAYNNVGLCNFIAGAAPTVNDDANDGYSPGSVWYKATVPYGKWKCVDATPGAAVWVRDLLYDALFASQSQNLFFASPNGSSGLPSFRAIAAQDFLSSVGTNRVVYLNGSSVPTSNANFIFDGNNLAIGAPTAPERLTVDKSGIVGTPTVALGIRNTTATSGAAGHQYSPAIEFEGHVRVESTATDKKATARNYLYAPYVPSGTTVQSKLLWQINRDGSGLEDMFELVNRSTQSPTDSNCFRFFSPLSNIALDMIIDTSSNIFFYSKDTTNQVYFVAKGIGGHSLYPGFDVSTYTKPTICATFGDPIVLRAGRAADGAGASGGEKVLCLIPLEVSDYFQVYKASGDQFTSGYSATQKWKATADSAGTTTFDAIGTTPKFIFADDVELADGKNFNIGASTGTVFGSPSSKQAWWGNTPVVQQEVTGSTGGNAALQSLLSKLDILGLIVDSTT